MKVICSSEESLYRPEAVRWRQRMELMKPLGDTVVLLPCSMKKPYSNSKSHQKFRKVSRSFQELIITSPFGICPRELENTFPIQSYDVAVTGSWSQDEIDESGKLLEKYVKGKNVIANVHGGYEEVCRQYLDECGKEGSKLIPDDVKTKGRYHRKIISNGKQLALLNQDTGLYRLNLAGGEILKDLNINVVNIDFDLETNTVFAPGIRKANHNIIPNDEVVVVKDDEVVGVGKAILTGREMEQCTNGIGVKIKHRVKNN